MNDNMKTPNGAIEEITPIVKKLIDEILNKHPKIIMEISVGTENASSLGLPYIIAFDLDSFNLG